MSDPNAPPLDEEQIIEVLNRHEVEYVLVGGLGARFHGATRRTLDFDVCPSWQRDNLGRLANALRELDAKLRGVPEDIALPAIDAQTLAPMELSAWRTAAGDVDVLLGIPADMRWNLSRFEALRERAQAWEVAGCTVFVAHLDDLIVSKRVTNRPPDLEALPELDALRSRLDSQET